jgi:hypothetical protein
MRSTTIPIKITDTEQNPIDTNFIICTNQSSPDEDALKKMLLYRQSMGGTLLQQQIDEGKSFRGTKSVFPTLQSHFNIVNDHFK